MTEVKVLIKPFEVIEDQIIKLSTFQYYAYVDHQFYYDYAMLEDLNNRGKFGVRAGDLRLFNVDTNTIENFPIYTKQFVKNTPPNFCITIPDTRNSKQKLPLDLYENIQINYSAMDIFEEESSSLIAYKNVHTGQLTYFTRETQTQITTINTRKTYVYGFLPLSICVDEKVDKQTEHHYEGAILTVRIYREYFIKSRKLQKYHFKRFYKDVEVPVMYDYAYADHPFVKINLNYNSAFDLKELSNSNLLKEVFADEIVEDPRQNWID